MKQAAWQDKETKSNRNGIKTKNPRARKTESSSNKARGSQAARQSDFDSKIPLQYGEQQVSGRS